MHNSRDDARQGGEGGYVGEVAHVTLLILFSVSDLQQILR
jgi:hypothetical protein